jgi:hypothetical protein
VTTAAHTILAAHLGLGDLAPSELLPAELCKMVDGAFFEHYRENLGRHAVMISFHMNGAEVYRGDTIEGDDVEVIATASRGGRTFGQVIALADLWRLPAAGIRLERVEPASKATAVFGLAETMDAQGRLWASVLWDQRGAPVALLDPETLKELMATGNDARRIDQVQRVDRSLTRDNVRAVAASSAQDYLGRQQDELTDGGQRPLWWTVFSFDTLSAADSNGPPVGPGGPRRYSLRSRVAGSIVADVTGRSKPYALGSSWSQENSVPDIDELASAHDENLDAFGRYHDAVEAHDGPGSMGPISGLRRDEVAWVDRTGDAGARLADGDINLSEIAQRVFTPETLGWRTAIGPLIDAMEERGLTEREAFVLANAEVGFPHEEIARAFGIPSVKTVATTIFRARTKLASPS